MTSIELFFQLANNNYNGKHLRLAGLGNADIYMLYIERCYQKQDP
jgi:hypothetical protein